VCMGRAPCRRFMFWYDMTWFGIARAFWFRWGMDMDLGFWVMNICKYSRMRFDVYIVYDSLRLVLFTTIFPKFLYTLMQTTSTFYPNNFVLTTRNLHKTFRKLKYFDSTFRPPKKNMH
jgi:hypothetical protein